MKIKQIEFEIPPEDLVNGCLDVLVTLEDDSCYFVEVTTPQFLEVLMKESEESKFLPPQSPYIIVSKLTGEIIKAALEDFIRTENDSYWLKLYHVTPTLNIEDINKILERKKQENLKLALQIELEIKLEEMLESTIGSNIFSDNQVILESISFLILGSLIFYYFLKPELFDLFSNLIN